MGLARVQAIAAGIAKMHRMTFQFGSEFEANQRVDASFARAMDALSGRVPAAAAGTLTGRQRSFEARIAAISGARHV
jgi:hypothetical protein